MHIKKFMESMKALHKLFISLILLLICATFSYGATPAGYSEYYIPGDENIMGQVWADIGAAGTVALAAPRHTIISVVAWSPSTTIYYDHWENGYNFDPNNPDATADEKYVLANAGDSKIFESSNIPVNPRGTAIYYDGRDRIYVAGGVVTVTRTSWDETDGTVFSLAWEVYPVKPQMIKYILPFGDDLYGAPRNYTDFRRVFALIQATKDNTVVTFDFNKDGTFGDTVCISHNNPCTQTATQVTLNAGQVFLLDRFAPFPTTGAVSLPTGTVIQGSDTLQVNYIVGDQTATYEARGFSAFPSGMWDNEYFAPVPSDAGFNYPTQLYVYNPQSSALTINYQTSATSGSFSVPAGQTRSFSEMTGGYVPAGSGVYLKASDVFWGVSTIDTGGPTHEWGYPLVPSFLLGNEHFFGWAPGSYPVGAAAGAGDPDANSRTDSGIFVTPAQDNTRVFIDTNHDGTPDQTYTLNRLQTQYVYDSGDGDMSNTDVWATGPIAIAYGQNPDTSPAAAPAIDLGYVSFPGGDFIDKVLTVQKTTNPVVVSTTAGATPTLYALTVNSYHFSVNSISVADTLPANWQYVNNSAVITLADMTTISGASANPTIAGQVLTWPSSLLGSMAANQTITITFTGQTTSNFNVGDITRNVVHATGTRTVAGATQTFVTSDFAFNSYGNLTVTKTSNAPVPLYPGNQFTYTVNVTNPSTTTFTGVSIYDPIPNGVSYAASSGSVTCEIPHNVRDEFAAAAYTNNNGSVNWSGAWTETDSLGGGAASGLVLVTGGQLQFQVGSSTGNANDPFTTDNTYNGGTGSWSGAWTEENDVGNPNYSTGTIRLSNANNRLEFTQCQVNQAIRRTANVTGATSATINFDLTDNGIDANETMIAEYSVDGGGYVNIGTLDGGAGWTWGSGGAVPLTIPLAGNNTLTLRFRAGGANWNQANDVAHLDNVDITYTVPVSANGSQIQRTANLIGAVNPQLSFSYSSANLAAGDTVAIEASNSAAGPFTTLATFAGGAPSVAPPYNLTPYISANTTIRYRVTGGFNAAGKTFSIDNVDITYGVPSTFASGNPPQFLVSGTGCRIRPGNSLTLTFNVTVDNQLASGIDQITNTASITTNEIILPLSASVTNLVVNPSSGNAQVGDRVWLDGNGNGVQDVGEPGLANVEVSLKSWLGATVMTTITDSTGHFLFTGVNPGNGYYIELTARTIPPGLQQSAPSGRSDNRTNAFNLVAGQSYMDADLGYKPAPGTATIGNLLWSDANSNGGRDEGEPGLAGVTVQLWLDANSNGIFEPATDTLVSSTTTAPDGSYMFTGVTASGTQDYFIYVDGTQAKLTGYTRTTPTNDPLYVSNLIAGDVIQYANFGYHSGSTYSIKDMVWFDANGNGSLDAGETGIAGVTADLLDASLNAIATATTDANGYFTFSGVIGGGADYTVKITDSNSKLANYFGTTAAAKTGTKQIINLTADIDNSSAPNFGYSLKGSIGGTVFNDINNNGTLNSGEPGISGVPVKLYTDANGNGQINAGTDTVVATLTADSYGNYLFSGLSNGNYIVSIESPPSGYTFTGTDSDPVTTGQQKAASIVSNGNSLSVNFSYHAAANRSVSGTIWDDANWNGAIDSGEPGIAGVTIALLQGSNVITTASTAADGTYSFSGLPSGTYTVQVTDNSAVLSNYFTTYEKTEGTTSPFNGQETVNLSSGNQTGITFGYSSAIPTRVVLSSFGAYEHDGQVVVEWETASEHNTLGFYLLRLDNVTGEYNQVTFGLLPSLHRPPIGGTYTFIDPGASPTGVYTYKLVEVEHKGRQLTYGPFTVTVEKDFTSEVPAPSLLTSDYTRTPREQSAVHMARVEARNAALSAQTSPSQQLVIGNRLKIAVVERGLYYVDADDISSSMNISLDKVSYNLGHSLFSLSSQGKQVAYLPSQDTTGRFTGLYFYANGIDSIYTRENIYWIDSGKGTLMPSANGRGPSSTGTGTFADTMHIEEDVFTYLSLFSDPNADYWFWQDLYEGGYGEDPPKDFPFSANGVAATGTATLTANLYGASSPADGTPHHHAVISVNGNYIGEGTWSGIQPYTINATFPQSYLLEGDNTITVENVLDSGVEMSYFLIDSFDLKYRRFYEAADDSLIFKGAGNPVLTVGGFTSPDIMVFEVTNPVLPRLQKKVTVDTSSLTVSLIPLSPTTPYFAVAGGGVKMANIEAVTSSTLSSKKNAADYIIIVPDETFLPAANDLASYRTGQGLQTMVVKQEDVMNEFNYGIWSPEAIKKFLSYAYTKWMKAPRYVVLAGDGSLDYKDNMGLGGSLIPTRIVATPFGLSASDTSLADFNGDHLPEIAVGRLPVMTADELQTIIGKIKTFEAVAGSRAILLADNPDSAGDFTANSEAVAAIFPSGYTQTKIYLAEHSIGNARGLLFTAINKGAGYFNYVGHGGPFQLADEGLLSNDPWGYDDLPSLTNAGELPVMTAMTCSVGDYSLPGYTVLAEGLLLKSDGGVAAVWSPTGYSDDAQASILNREFYMATFSGGKKVLGDAVLQALGVFKTTAGSMPFMMDVYNILGDPALELR